MKLSVLVATFGRRRYFEKCIASLLEQHRLPDEIVIVTRLGDDETEQAAKAILHRGHPSVRLLHGTAKEPGVLAANRVGMGLVTGDIVSFIDDDAVARPDWLRRIESRFEQDPKLGALGGRDVQHTKDGIRDKATNVVGRIHWYGRISGNHEKAFPRTAYVDHLKGVNMSYRKELLPAFDELIQGNAHHYEMDLCFAVRRQGYRVMHDGTLMVDHYVNAPRYLSGFQPGGDAKREYYIHHNRVYVMMKNLGPVRQGMFLFYAFVVDAVDDTFETLRGRPGKSPEVLWATLHGRAAGLRDYLRSRGRCRRVSQS